MQGNALAFPFFELYTEEILQMYLYIEESAQYVVVYQQKSLCFFTGAWTLIVFFFMEDWAEQSEMPQINTVLPQFKPYFTVFYGFLKNFF